MNGIALFDGLVRDDLFPFTLTRSVVDIRVGILTIREKWAKRLNLRVDLNPADDPRESKIGANLIPGKALSGFDYMVDKQQFVAATAALSKIQYPWQIFELNAQEITNDFELLTLGRKSMPISETNRIINPGQVFMEDGAKMEHAFINAAAGPVYIGKNAEIMEGAMIRGPFALCEGAVVKMGATIYGATTVGPHSVVGGEIKNSVILGYSNKSHEGYLGDAVIGEWCNLGAGTSNSNLKNNAGKVEVYNQPKQAFLPAGHKCGLLMGDYSRSAINTSFNTGTVTGVCCNIFAQGLTPKFIPSFSWGSTHANKYDFDLAIRDIARWKKFKNQDLSDIEIRTLKHIFDQNK